ncbi:MAG: hypothetical protein JNK26_04065 [Candidatus Doudnabacteria bacterium]|nr:hypothetical protein [Candidatus Doudnabacteria bacterium]
MEIGNTGEYWNGMSKIWVNEGIEYKKWWKMMEIRTLVITLIDFGDKIFAYYSQE